MRHLSGPALVEGLSAAGAVVFKEKTTGQETEVGTDPMTGRFRVMLPEGKYIVRAKGDAPGSLTRTFLPGASYRIDLRPGKTVDFEVSDQQTAPNETKTVAASPKWRVTIRVTARGTGAHHFTIRMDNLLLPGTGKSNATSSAARRELILQAGQTGTVEWQATILSRDTPWVVVVIPDDDLSQRQELTGNR